MATPLPDDFKCPISLEIMSDPVILSSGHTFDRSSIQRWLDSGHRNCPITKLPLSDSPVLIPNHALRSLISNYTLVSLPKSKTNSDPQTLISILTTPSSSLEEKLNSLDQLIRLAKRDSVLRRRLTESGAVSAVLKCVSSNVAALEEKALNLILHLSLDDDNKVGLVAEGAIGNIIGALRGGGGGGGYCRAVAATTLTSLALVEVNKGTIGAYPFAISTLVMLIESGNVRERREATTALFTICSFSDNRRRAVECGAVPVLLGVIGLGVERAIEVLGLLVKCKEGRVELGKYNCVSILVNAMKDGSSRCVQYGLYTIHLLCHYSETMCLEAVREGIFEFCLGFLEDDNEKVRINASNLVKVLKRKRNG